MPLPSWLLDIVVCPLCHVSLRELAEDRGLECAGCGRVYPVRDGIAVLLLDEATRPASGEAAR
jgi:uncharacterized protein YbaR (Trm112 family)